MKDRKEILSGEDTDTVVVYTDGSCYPNPDGPGGWAFYCTFKGKQAVRYGCSPKSTNNIMEVSAILHALRYVPAGPKFDYPLLVFTDSRYAKDALTKWVLSWQKHSWTTSSGSPVKNRELIEETVRLLNLHKKHRPVELRWVKGHAGTPENELCDQRAGYARKQQATNWKSSDNKNK